MGRSDKISNLTSELILRYSQFMSKESNIFENFKHTKQLVYFTSLKTFPRLISIFDK